jgi:broad specificity phosphatase PhoE
VAPPEGESLRDVTARLLPHWYDSIVPDLRTGECVLVVSHGNTLRALIKHLDGIGDDEIAALEVPNGVPILYDLDPDTWRPLTKGGHRVTQHGSGSLSVRHGPMAFATVRLGRDGDATTFHVHGSGLVINRIVNEFGIART